MIDPVRFCFRQRVNFFMVPLFTILIVKIAVFGFTSKFLGSQLYTPGTYTLFSLQLSVVP